MNIITRGCDKYEKKIDLKSKTSLVEMGVLDAIGDNARRDVLRDPLYRKRIAEDG